MPVDFQNATETARGQINDWVASQTDDKIPELFGAGSLSNLTRLVLTNANLAMSNAAASLRVRRARAAR